MKRRTNITAGKISLSIFWTFFSLFFLYTFTCCTGCAESNNRKNGENSVAENILNEIALNWFYFDGTGALVRAENPSLIPAVEFKPWTEAVSVLDAGFSGQEPVLLVNKMGLLSSSMVAMSGSSVVFPNAEKLSSGTAASLASENGKTYIRFYRNSVFSRNPLSQPVSLFFCTDSAPEPTFSKAVVCCAALPPLLAAIARIPHIQNTWEVLCLVVGFALFLLFLTASKVRPSRQWILCLLADVAAGRLKPAAADENDNPNP